MQNISIFSVCWTVTFRKFVLCLLALLLLAVSSPLCLASSWLIPAGHYKAFSTFSTIDKKSAKLKSIHGEAYLDLQYQLLELSKERQLLQDQIDNNRGIATNNQKRLLREIDQEISALKQASSEEKAYQDKETINFTVEYGLDDDINLGSKIGYKQEKFASSLGRSNPIISREVDIFFKYKLLKQDKFIMTVQPKIYLDRYARQKESWFSEIGLMLGYSFNNNIFCDTGIFFASCFTSRCDTKNIVGISFAEGLKLNNGFALYNFTKYYVRKTDNTIYRRSVYEQILFAKEIELGDLNHNYFTLAAGYYFDQSLTDSSFKLSGPIISLWLEL